MKLNAQLYDDADYVRLFDGENPNAIADIKIELGNPDHKTLKNSADAALNFLGIRRKSSWLKRDWGFESKVIFPKQQT